MSYVSLKFLIFIVLLLFLYYIFPKKYRWYVLLAGSIYFYVLFSGKLILFILLSTLITYLGSLFIEKYPLKKRLIISIVILFNLLFLIVLKYNNFFSGIINPVLSIFSLKIPYKVFILPIGISYYTLETIAYIVDINRKKICAEKNPLKLLLAFIYFPKIVEGPICKYSNLSSSLFNTEKFDYMKFRSSLILVAYGFIKKLVVADACGPVVDHIFDNSSYTGLVVLFSVCLYTLQIYCDFSGCIDIVSGISNMFNIKLDKNFDRPFFSKSIQEFWRRWHITLGTWLKDYIFYPISLSKMNMKLNIKLKNMKSKYLARFIMVAFPLFFVWIINGLWHGPTIKYVMYGMYYYILMMLGVLLKPLFDKIISILKINTKSRYFKLFQIIRTILIVCIGMFIFRSESLSEFGIMFKNIFRTTNASIFGLGFNKQYVSMFVGTIIVCVVELLEENGKNIIEFIEGKNIFIRWCIYLFLIFVIIMFGSYGRTYSASSFIYGGF